MNRLDSLSRQIRICQRCRLGKTRTKAVPGEGSIGAKIFLVGEAPGREEDITGMPFCGPSGGILDRTLKSLGLKRSELFVTSVNKCRPPRNRRPRANEVAACRPYLVKQIDVVKPHIIIALGRHSLSALTVFSGEIARARNESFGYHGIPLVATYHPAAVLYNRRLQVKLRHDMIRAMELMKKVKPRVGGMRPVDGKGHWVRISSGGIPWDGGTKFLLIRRMDEGLWCLPKGGVSSNETLEDAALREVREETGLAGRIICPVKNVNFAFYEPESGVNFNKTVHYFLVKVRKGTVKLERGFEDYRWCTYPEAISLLHYDNDKEVLSLAMKSIRRSR